jgi:hypothetical protein
MNYFPLFSESEEGYVEAEITATKGDQVTVKVAGGEVGNRKGDWN